MPLQNQPLESGRPPQLVRPCLWLFSPNRDCQGGSSWLLETPELDLLIDCPALTEANLAFLQNRADQRQRHQAEPGGWIVMTSREGHGHCSQLQHALPWPVLIQEQEAYMLPDVTNKFSFKDQYELGQGLRLLWTPGPSPGSCVLHAAPPSMAALDGLFCGRLLVPVAAGQLAPLRTPRCFHWPRQLNSLKRLLQWLPTGSPDWIASGAALGALQGEKLVSGRSLLQAAA